MSNQNTTDTDQICLAFSAWLTYSAQKPLFYQLHELISAFGNKQKNPVRMSTTDFEKETISENLPF